MVSKRKVKFPREYTTVSNSLKIRHPNYSYLEENTTNMSLNFRSSLAAIFRTIFGTSKEMLSEFVKKNIKDV